MRTRCAGWLLRWEPRPKGAPAPSEDRPSFAARCGIRERERHLGTGYGFGIFVGERFAGEVTLSSIQRGPFQSAFIGYWVDEALAGRGLVPEAVVVALRFAFEAISLHRVEISIIPRNTASRRVVEKLGIREEGVALRFLEIDGAVGGPRPLRHHGRGVGRTRAASSSRSGSRTEPQASPPVDHRRRVAEELLDVVLVGVRRRLACRRCRRSRSARMNVCTAPALVAL